MGQKMKFDSDPTLSIPMLIEDPSVKGSIINFWRVSEKSLMTLLQRKLFKTDYTNSVDNKLNST